MAYGLTRAVIVLMGWGVTSWIIMNVWPQAAATIYCVAGVSWLLAGVAYVSYLKKLRHDVAQLHDAFAGGYGRPQSAVAPD